MDFLTEASAFRTIYIASGIWQDAGWGIIVYMATLSNIDTSLYEAAKVDGDPKTPALYRREEHMKAQTETLKPSGFSERTSDIILVAVCAVILLIVAYPLYYVLIASVSNPYDVYAGKTFLLPSQFTLDGYKAVFADPSILSGLLNSFKYTIVGTVFSVVMLYFTAYPLSVRDLPGRKFFSIFFIITMYFGGGLVPTYLIVKETGLLGSMWALFLPGGVAVGNMIIMRNFFENSIPKEMIEAAEIDGCTQGRFFFQIALPLSGAITAIMVLYYGVGHWNSYFSALIYMSDQNKFPLQLVLRSILITNEAALQQAATTPEAREALNAKKELVELMKYSLIIISSIPVLVLYPFIQRHFVKGVMIGSVKG